ncbi:hypothetical protein FIBSPDRAFT_903935 [Athelia psychrophila]|uniref:Uncharacterized protein n=1 Tax=Athelia psychrophila TaxID=1759441 RepID=A0A167VCR6_9AGAM|nr:hypothetical protein FIBSPDRAFT_903935 [Fibularhizoctonia sp. CBS 109695]
MSNTSFFDAANAGNRPYTAEQEMIFLKYHFFLRDRDLSVPVSSETHPPPRQYLEWVLAEQHNFPALMPPWIAHRRIAVDGVLTIVITPTAGPLSMTGSVKVAAPDEPIVQRSDTTRLEKYGDAMMELAVNGSRAQLCEYNGCTSEDSPDVSLAAASRRPFDRNSNKPYSNVNRGGSSPYKGRAPSNFDGNPRFGAKGANSHRGTDRGGNRGRGGRGNYRGPVYTRDGYVPAHGPNAPARDARTPTAEVITPVLVVDGALMDPPFDNSCTHAECAFTPCVYKPTIEYSAAESFAPTDADLEKLAAAAQTFAEMGVTVSRGPIKDLISRNADKTRQFDLGVGSLSLSDADAYGETNPEDGAGPSTRVPGHQEITSSDVANAGPSMLSSVTDVTMSA